jgi:hypothetical protein
MASAFKYAGRLSQKSAKSNVQDAHLSSKRRRVKWGRVPGHAEERLAVKADIARYSDREWIMPGRNHGQKANVLERRPFPVSSYIRIPTPP